MMIIPNVCANCGKEIMMDHNGADFCDVQCAEEFDLMILEFEKKEKNFMKWIVNNLIDDMKEEEE